MPGPEPVASVESFLQELHSPPQTTSTIASEDLNALIARSEALDRENESLLQKNLALTDGRKCWLKEQLHQQAANREPRRSPLNFEGLYSFNFFFLWGLIMFCCSELLAPSLVSKLLEECDAPKLSRLEVILDAVFLGFGWRSVRLPKNVASRKNRIAGLSMLLLLIYGGKASLLLSDLQNAHPLLSTAFAEFVETCKKRGAADTAAAVNDHLNKQAPQVMLRSSMSYAKAEQVRKLQTLQNSPLLSPRCLRNLSEVVAAARCHRLAIACPSHSRSELMVLFAMFNSSIAWYLDVLIDYPIRRDGMLCRPSVCRAWSCSAK